MLKRLLLLGIVVLLSACSSYQARTVAGGYSDSNTGRDIYTINYRGNNYEDYDTVKGFTLTRAARLTANHGMRYFEIVSVEDLSKKYQSYTPPTNASPSFYNENTSPPVIHTYNGNIVTHDQVELVMTIRLLAFPSDRTYDAQALLAK